MGRPSIFRQQKINKQQVDQTYVKNLMDMTQVNNIMNSAQLDNQIILTKVSNIMDSTQFDNIIEDENIIEDDEYISNPVTKNSISTVSNLKTANNLSNASTNGCISLKSSKLNQKRKRCSFVLSNMSILNDQKYKTENCAYFLNGIECPYAQNCQFAHGQQQKRSKKNDKVQFKTKLCDNFFLHGACTYGTRCLFLHKKNQLEREKQYYRKKMSQIHKDTFWFFLDDKRLSLLKQVQFINEVISKRSISAESSKRSSKSDISSASSKKSVQKSVLSLAEYKKKIPKIRNCSIRV